MFTRYAETLTRCSIVVLSVPDFRKSVGARIAAMLLYAICLAVETWLLEKLAQISADFSPPEPSRIRPYKLELLLDQCDANADETDEVHAWRDLNEVGREQLDQCAAPKKPI
ncbi:hypothetical protein [Halomonas campaniensis]|nr:hypothetical protein [Halomonas campaniensis]